MESCNNEEKQRSKCDLSKEGYFLITIISDSMKCEDDL